MTTKVEEISGGTMTRQQAMEMFYENCPRPVMIDFREDMNDVIAVAQNAQHGDIPFLDLMHEREFINWMEEAKAAFEQSGKYTLWTWIDHVYETEYLLGRLNCWV